MTDGTCMQLDKTTHKTYVHFVCVCGAVKVVEVKR